MRLPSLQTRTMNWIGMASLASVMLLPFTVLVVVDEIQSRSDRLVVVLLADLFGWADVEETPALLQVDVHADGQIEVAGESLTVAELDQRLRQQIAATTGNLEVKIQGPRDVPFRHVSAVMSACARADVSNVLVSTK